MGVGALTLRQHETTNHIYLSYDCTQNNELLDKLPTCPHLQREPQIVQGAEKPHCGGGQQRSKAKGKGKAATLTYTLYICTQRAHGSNKIKTS